MRHGDLLKIHAVINTTAETVIRYYRALCTGLSSSWRLHLLLGRQPRYLIGVIFGIVLGVLPAGIPYMWFSKVESLPAIHDISTDMVNPPRFQPGVLALRKSPENSTV